MTELRLRGAPPALWVSAALAAAPAVLVAYERARHPGVLSPALFALALVAATLPWLSRLAGRLTYRASMDEVALHVAGEALPWNTITRVTRRRSWRRTLLILERGRTTTLVLCTRDLFAGRLAPMAELEARLAGHLDTRARSSD